MSHRWLKQEICESDRYNACSLRARDLFTRLIVKADDHGLFEGNGTVVAHLCYPKGSVRSVSSTLDELEKNDLIIRYVALHCPWLIICDWFTDRIRAEPKYPLPSGDILERARAQEKTRQIMLNPDGLQPHAGADPRAQTLASVLAHDARADASRPAGRTQASGRDRGLGFTALQLFKPTSSSGGGAISCARARPANGNGHEQQEEIDYKVKFNQNTGGIEVVASQRLQWQDEFPELVVIEELTRASRWIKAHPDSWARLKPGAFLVNWLIQADRQVSSLAKPQQNQGARP